MAEWTGDAVAARFEESARTAQRLPRVSVQGYFNTWPAFRREVWETCADEADALRPLPPTPQAIERMRETMQWVQWIEVETRHIVWMRARGIDWRTVCRRIGCERTTAWRRWRRALQLVARELNAAAQVGGN